VSTGLFRRHVLGSANNRSSDRHHGCGYGVVHGTGSGRIGASCQTEIKQLHAVLSQKSVGGFQVAVNNAEVVKCLKCFQNLPLDADCFRPADRATREAVRQRLPFQQFQD
jgi:hypothetical protein